MSDKRPLFIPVLAVAAVLVFSAAALFARETKSFLYERQYEKQRSGYEQSFFAGQKVLFIVPHEDDDLNLAQGVIESYVKAGSEVYVLFATNGDHTNTAKERLDEAVLAETANGVSPDHLIFLGYGNDWDPSSGYDHLYDAPDDILMTSAAGYSATYGSENISDFHTSVYGGSAPYTRGSFISDLQEVLIRLRPDTVFCSDLDEHPDHRAVSLFFDTVMGRILSRKDNDYHPLIFKGFAYCNGWDGKPDYYGFRVPSTENPSDRKYHYNDKHDDPDYLPHERAYNWSERIRIPVATDILAYSKRASSAHRSLSAYRSQNAIGNFEKIVKADKVYWMRPSDGLLYGAGIKTSSGEAAFLNDFMLYDTCFSLPPRE